MEVIQQIGAYAGLASIIGLAVLSALYFSQARDLRRLRDWAGRAPERTAAPVAPPSGAPKPVAQPSAQTAQQTAVVPVPAAAQGATGAEGSSSASAAPGAKPGATGNGQGAAPPRVPPPVPIRTGAAGATAGAPRLPGPAATAARPPWYRRLAPRYVALAVAGLLVIGAGAAYALGALDGLTTSGDADQPTAGGAVERDTTGGATRRGGASDPSSVTFAVLNGTQVEGLAKQIADKLESGGYRRGNVTNATEQQKAESAVLYASGARREAVAVARRLDISQIEPVDPASQSLAGDATVIVIVGADQTP